MVDIENAPDEQEPQDFVVVLAYTSTDGEIDENFGRFVNDIKALYTFKDNVRAYALVEEAAKNVLRKVEKPKEGSSNKTVLVISFDNPEDADDAARKLQTVAENVRPQFEGLPDVDIRIGVRDVADEVLGSFGGQG